jgi:hypothetical protein
VRVRSCRGRRRLRPIFCVSDRCGFVPAPRLTASAGNLATGPPLMSTSQSPPRKRVRSHRSNSGAATVGSGANTRSSASSMISDDALDSQEHSPPANGANKGRKMRLHKSKNRQRSSNNGASLDEGTLGDVVGSDDENDASSSDESSVTSSLVRKVKRRTHLSSTDHEIVRLIGQHLTNIGLKTSADVLVPFPIKLWPFFLIVALGPILQNFLRP